MTLNKIISISFGLFLLSCNSSTTPNVETTEIQKVLMHSDPITFGNLIGTWTLKDSKLNADFKTFIIDSSGFHNLTDGSTNHYKLLVEGNIFAIGIHVTDNKNLITYHSKDTLKIYWTSGQHETYIRLTETRNK